MLKVPTVISVLCLSVLLSACDKRVAAPPMLHPHAVLYLHAGSDQAESPVSQNFSVSPEGLPKDYGGRLLALQDKVEVQYSFIGTGRAWVANSVPRETIESDVYLVNIHDQNGAAYSLSVIYSGDQKVIYETQDVKLLMGPAH